LGGGRKVPKQEEKPETNTKEAIKGKQTERKLQWNTIAN